MLDLKLDREGVPPKDAATILLVRDHDGHLELFCVERSKQSRFLGGAIVFPGGKLDAGDADPAWLGLVTPVRSLAGRAVEEPFTRDDEHHRALAIAACRETLEEAAMLHVTRATIADAELLELRARLVSDPRALREYLLARQAKLDLGALHPFARWVTPEAEARRFDARFFLAEAPEGQHGAHDDHETMASFWATPSEVLRRWEAGEVALAPPTHRSIQILAGCANAAAALAVADASDLSPVCPRLVRSGDTIALVLPGDPEHAVGQARLPGRSRYLLRGDRWIDEDAPR